MWSLPTPEEFVFRDGRRMVPEHLAPLFRRLETYRMTYAEAIAEAHRLIGSDFINAQQDSILAAHFRKPVI